MKQKTLHYLFITLFILLRNNTYKKLKHIRSVCNAINISFPNFEHTKFYRPCIENSILNMV